MPRKRYDNLHFGDAVPQPKVVATYFDRRPVGRCCVPEAPGGGAGGGPLDDGGGPLDDAGGGPTLCVVCSWSASPGKIHLFATGSYRAVISLPNDATVAFSGTPTSFCVNQPFHELELDDVDGAPCLGAAEVDVDTEGSCVGVGIGFASIFGTGSVLGFCGDTKSVETGSTTRRSLRFARSGG